MHPIIFLDIDGVLSTARTGWTIDPSLVERLSETVRSTDANVVLCSTWREENIRKTLRFLPTCLQKIISGQTPALLSGNRSEEIRQYLMTHPADKYAIIDDEDTYPEFQHKHLVLTNPETGLTHEDCEKTILILNT